MDDLLALLIPEMKSIQELEKHQKVYSWGGNDYPQEPVIYQWGPRVEFRTSKIQPYLLDLLPKDHKDESWLVLDVNEEALDLLEIEINGKEVDWGGRRLDEILKLILEQHKKWVLILELNYDQIDAVYYLTVDDCIEKLKSNYKRGGKREGFIVVGTQSRV